jgi:hypothetical protein
LKNEPAAAERDREKNQEQTNMRKQWVALLSVLGLTGSVMRSESQVLKGSKPDTQAATNETVKKNPAVQNPKLDLKQQTLRQQNPAGVANKAPGAKAVGQNTGTCRYSEGCNNQVTKGNKLDLKQQTLRQQNPGAGKQADPLTPSAYCNKNQTAANNQQLTKGAKANNQLTPPPPGVNTSVTRRDNQQITKGNNAITKGNNAVTKGSNQLTPPPPGANNAITKGNNAITKGNQQITKGNQQITKGNQQVTKGNQQVTKANNAITK